MTLGQDIVYLSNADIEACAIGVATVEAAVEAMFAAKAAGSAVMKPKLALHAPGRPLFLASAGMMESPHYAGVKWVGVGDNAARGLPHIAGTILLSDDETGMPVAIMDAAWVTGVRTAAITAVAARRLARPDSAVVGFVACGLQARAHLAALRAIFPLARVVAYSRRLSTAEAFTAEARELGLEAQALEDPRQALEGADIVITSTPAVPRTPAFLDAGWLAPGSFTGIVDMGIPWISESLGGLDRVVTDDIAQAGSERLNNPKPYDGEVADLVAGTAPGRQSADERSALLFAGVGLADVAVGALVYETARDLGLGQTLPL